jgi:hypothetical protein
VGWVNIMQTLHGRDDQSLAFTNWPALAYSGMLQPALAPPRASPCRSIPCFHKLACSGLLWHATACPGPTEGLTVSTVGHTLVL